MKFNAQAKEIKAGAETSSPPEEEKSVRRRRGGNFALLPGRRTTETSWDQPMIPVEDLPATRARHVVMRGSEGEGASRRDHRP